LLRTYHKDFSTLRCVRHYLVKIKFLLYHKIHFVIRAAV